MLTLLEPPRSKRSPAQANRSAQHLLNLAPDEDEFYETEYEPPNEMRNTSGGWLTSILDNYLVWKSSSDEYIERWKKEFRIRPSWADADLCLQQIKRGKATGNTWALYSRSFIQKILFALGNFVNGNAWKVILTIIALFSVCLYGLQFVHIETDIVKLWVAKGGRLDAELNFLPEIQRTFNSSEGMEMVRENGLGGGYQVIIQTPEYEGQNALSLEGLLKHVNIMKEIASFKVEAHGSTWTFNDICFKPSPPLGDDAVAKQFEHIIERIVPCIWITPIDCFWEGGKALGPHPPVTKKDIGFVGGLLKSLPDSNHVKWTNFDPIGVINEIHKSFSLGAHHSFFERAGIGRGYLDRPCMDPLDPECPSASPNYYDVCPYMDKFLEYTRKNKIIVDYIEEVEDEEDSYSFDFFDTLEGLVGGGRSKRDLSKQQNTTDIKNDHPLNVTNSTTTTESPEEIAKRKAAEICKRTRGGMMKWMSANKDKWKHFLLTTEYPQYPDFGNIMKNGCPGFASEVLHWPSDMILGGVKRNESRGPLTHADALQSVFLVASPNDVYLRFKDRINMTKENEEKFKSSREMLHWNETIAEEIIQTWQRNFTKRMYNHEHNFDTEGNIRRTIHPLASTSIADMLEEFCQFNFKIIFIGYGLMLAYAMFTQFKHEQLMPSSESCMGLALIGVLTVTFASVSGLGLATWFGIEFNAATTQIVPFLTLGIGVDNMFMLLHNYHEVLHMTSHHEIAILMRETGMSILCTSINNILSFLAGTVLPIPALRSFCAQSSILLTFNFIAILTMYPAMIAIDLRRRKAGRRDICCCLYGDTRDEEYSMIHKPHAQEKRTIGERDNTTTLPMIRPIANSQTSYIPKPKSPWTLHSVIKRFYIPLLNKKWFRLFVLIGSALLLFLSVQGMRRANMGLELSDILPEQTAPAKFLQARDKYFSFYPMFAVLKGPNIDYARQQHQIENYRRAISSSKFVIKTATDEPSEKYWLQMMRDWLSSIQRGFDQAYNDGKISTEGNITGNISDDAKIGLRLICSFGNTYDCTGRIGKVRLVDKSGTINYDGFYNYLTAWFNQENMMYYVSQASFYPTPPQWSLSDNTTLLVPPAEPLAYSQIPFYLTGLTDTPVVVEMIKDIRAVCDKFTDQLLPNFPQGIAFTFWEQYLHLNENLIQAIGIIALAVFVVISVLLFNPWAAFSVLVIVIAMTVELAGFLGWAGIKMNPVSAVTLITAVGIGVEFTVHVVLAYLTSLGSRRERTSHAVDRVFVPVIHGAFSTLLGIIMLGFSEFEFVKKYFFYVMFALIVIGVINGLILLPVLLSIAGPPQEIHPNPEDCPDNVIRLALPPPIRPRRRRNQTTEEDEEEAPGLQMRPSSVYVCLNS